MDKRRGTCEGRRGERNGQRLYTQGHDRYNLASYKRLKDEEDAENADEEMERKDGENIVYTSIIKRVNGEEIQRAGRG